MDTLPLANIALILPTLNNGVEMAKHLDALEPIIHEFGQIIAVDSYSEDGTYEILKERLPQNVIIEQYPRGLYQCWNYAISLVSTPYSYISTIGDLVDPGLLKEMAVFVDENDMDISISPPKFKYQDSNLCNDEEWAIYSIIDALRIKDTYIFSSEVLRNAQAYVVAKYGVHSLFGSMASNLVKTSLLKKVPFNCDYSGVGDVLWASDVIELNSKVAIFNKNVAIFLIHKKSYQKLEVKKHEELLEKITFSTIQGMKDFQIIRVLTDNLALRNLILDLRANLFRKVFFKPLRESLKRRIKNNIKSINLSHL